MWRRMVEQQPSHLLLAHASGQVDPASSLSVRHVTTMRQAIRAEIWAIYVRPESWSSGAGRALWLETLRRIVAEGYKSISLWVISGNERAVFYERAGFVVDRESCKSFELGGTTLEELRYVRHAD